jgi:hypothetical protein
MVVAAFRGQVEADCTEGGLSFKDHKTRDLLLPESNYEDYFSV